MKFIRIVLGSAVLAWNRFFAPTSLVKRSSEEQMEVDEKLKVFAIYQFVGCPFCVKVRRALVRMNIEIELRNCESGPYREELIKEGGELQVPCLKIPEANGKYRWMYESSDIIAYLEKLTAPAT